MLRDPAHHNFQMEFSTKTNVFSSFYPKETLRTAYDGRGVEGRGWARNRIIRLQESLVLYKSFNNLLSYTYSNLPSPIFDSQQLHEVTLTDIVVLTRISNTFFV
jgi:hypothetical protein